MSQCSLIGLGKTLTTVLECSLRYLICITNEARRTRLIQDSQDYSLTSEIKNAGKQLISSYSTALEYLDSFLLNLALSSLSEDEIKAKISNSFDENNFYLSPHMPEILAYLMVIDIQSPFNLMQILQTYILEWEFIAESPYIQQAFDIIEVINKKESEQFFAKINSEDVDYMLTNCMTFCI